MKRGAVFIILGVLLLTFFLAQINNNASMSGKVVDDLQVSEEEAGSSRAIVAEEVLEKLEKDKDEQVRVFVNLKDSKKSRSTSSKDEIKEIVKGKVMYVSEEEMSMYVSEEELLELQDNPNIESIELVKMRTISLQGSVPLINGTATWNLQPEGNNLTGEGQAICIIDTGIKYTHADFGNCYGNNTNFSCKVVGGWDFCADDTICNLSVQDDDPMDVEGHGTHVAGIAAANGSIKGVAPGAKIIMIKAANATGSFWDDNLKAAMDWCIDNASTFNISVISMSLGGLFSNPYGNTTNCDIDPLTDWVNDAVAAGISVVAATGNNGYTDKIHGPACISSATPIGSIRKDDSTIDYNRNNLTMLIAPGYSINSTYTSSAYTALSGTSMATPHAAGAIAIINQYLDLQGGSMTPSEIEQTLNDTGKITYDSGSGLNFSRIDVYSMILSIDEIDPEVNLISPTTSSVSYNENQTFLCNITDDIELSNVTFYLWNSSGSLINQTTQSASGDSDSLEINQASLNNDTYAWNCKATDHNGNSAFANANYTIRIGEMIVTLNSPATPTYKSTNSTTFNCSAEDGINLSNATLYIWNSTGSLKYNTTNNVTGLENSTTFTYNLTNEITYSWNCKFVNENGISKYASSNYTVTLDMNDPEIELESPDNEEELSDSEVDFAYTPTDTNIKNCSLYIDGDLEETDTSITSGDENEFSNVDLEDDGDYEWKVRCFDKAGNSDYSEEWDLTIDSSSGVSGDDDSSSDDDTQTTTSTYGGNSYTITDKEIQQGVNRSLRVNDIVKFKTDNTTHTLTVKSASASELKITISSDPVDLTIKIGAKEMADLDADHMYDVEVQYISFINDIFAKTFIKEVDVPVPASRQITTDAVDNNETIGTEAPSGPSFFEKTKQKLSAFWNSKTGKVIVFVILGVLLLGVLGFLVYWKRNAIIDSTVRVLSKSEEGLRDLKDKKGDVAMALNTEHSKASKKHKSQKKNLDEQLSRENFREEQYF